MSTVDKSVDDRVRIGIALAPPTEVSAWLAEAAALDAAGANALWIDLAADEELDPFVLAAALAAVTHRCLLVLDLPEDPKARRTLQQVSRGRVLVARDEANRWERVDMPAGRAAWREAMAEAKERGTHGMVLPADPRLLDLLRNPDEDIDRRDLQLAAG